MDLKETVNQILSSRSNIQREEIMKMIENKKREAGGFLSNETAARLVASELGVEIAKKQIHLKIQIKDLVSGLNDVSLAGQVISVYPPKTFKRRDWTEGKLASILISDDSGTLRVILWDNKADLVEKGKIQQEQTIRVSHAYAREGQDGKPELHVGDKGSIKILSDEAKELAEIKEAGGPFTVEGTVASTPDVREVTTTQNERVAVASFRLRLNRRTQYDSLAKTGRNREKFDDRNQNKNEKRLRKERIRKPAGAFFALLHQHRSFEIG
jgi:replication factor A1